MSFTITLRNFINADGSAAIEAHRFTATRATRPAAFSAVLSQLATAVQKDLCGTHAGGLAEIEGLYRTAVADMRRNAPGIFIESAFKAYSLEITREAPAPAPQQPARPALTAQQPAQQQQADAGQPAAPVEAPALTLDMLKPDVRATVEAVAAAGFDVYMRDARDGYLYFTDGARVAYLEHSRYGGVTRSTVHVANRTTGTGFRLDDDGEGPALVANREWLLGAFVHAPNWAGSRDRESVVKYRDFATFANGSASWGGGLKLVAPAAPVEPAPAPAMVPMPAQQQQADASRFSADAHTEAAEWLGYVAACAETAPDVAGFDAAVTEAVDTLLRRHSITPRAAACLLAFFDAPRGPVVAAIVPPAVAMVPMPVQQQQACARRGMARSEGDGTWQVGIYCLARNDRGQWVATATGPGTIGDGYVGTWPTWAAAYEGITGEAAPGARPVMVPMPAQQQQGQHRPCPVEVGPSVYAMGARAVERFVAVVQGRRAGKAWARPAAVETTPDWLALATAYTEAHDTIVQGNGGGMADHDAIVYAVAARFDVAPAFVQQQLEAHEAREQAAYDAACAARRAGRL